MAARRNILVIKLGALGDFVQALGPMAAIRRHHTSDHITLLTTKPYADIGRQSGYFDRTLIDERPKWYDFSGWVKLRQILNAGHFGRVYDLQNNDRSALYLKLLSPRPEWVGAAPGASHRNASPERTAGTAFEGHVQTLALAGIADVRIDTLGWMGKPGSIQGLKSPYVLIVPGSAPNHPEKRWPVENYAALCGHLTIHGLQPVLIGTQSEAGILSSIAQTEPFALNLCGKTQLCDLPALAREAAGAIGNDTGPMHLIAPTGCPSVVLFSGKSHPHRHRPGGVNVRCLQRDMLQDLSVEEVLAAFNRRL